MTAVPTLNLSDAQIARAGELLTEFLRRYERSIPAPKLLPPLDRGVLADLLREPFPEIGIGVDRLEAAVR